MDFYIVGNQKKIHTYIYIFIYTYDCEMFRVYTRWRFWFSWQSSVWLLNEFNNSIQFWRIQQFNSILDCICEFFSICQNVKWDLGETSQWEFSSESKPPTDVYPEKSKLIDQRKINVAVRTLQLVFINILLTGYCQKYVEC